MIYLRIMNHNHSWRTMVGFSLKEHAVFSPGRGRVDHRTIGRIRELPTTSSAPWDNISTQRWRLAEKNIQETQQKTAKLCKTGLQQWLEPNEMMWPSLTKKKNLGKGPRLAKFWFHGTNVTPWPAWHTEIAGSLQHCSTGKGLPRQGFSGWGSSSEGNNKYVKAPEIILIQAPEVACLMGKLQWFLQCFLWKIMRSDGFNWWKKIELLCCWNQCGKSWEKGMFLIVVELKSKEGTKEATDHI